MKVIKKVEELSTFQLVQTILQQSKTPPCVIINDVGNIIYIHGRTGHFLEQPEGHASINLIEMARTGLKNELSAAIENVSGTRQEIQFKGIRVQINGGHTFVDLTVKPILEQTALHGAIMVIFEETIDPCNKKQNKKPSLKRVLNTTEKKDLKGLEREVQNTRENLQTTIEELETSNEELQSTNEELQSTNEELETSKEELQSLNEESITVNIELQSRIDELSKVNDDMKNLLDSTQTATIFLDIDLNIRRFTPTATKIFPLNATDIGRPISHLVSNLQDQDVGILAQKIIDTLEKVETEVLCKDGTYYQMRILPYRTINNIIDGVVITFENISRIKEIETQLRLSEERFRVALKSSPLGIIVANTDTELRYTWIYNSHKDFNQHNIIGKRDDEIAQNEGTIKLYKLKKKVRDSGVGSQEIITFPLSTGTQRYQISAEPLFDEKGDIKGVTTASVDITTPSNLKERKKSK